MIGFFISVNEMSCINTLLNAEPSILVFSIKCLPGHDMCSYYWIFVNALYINFIIGKNGPVFSLLYCSGLMFCIFLSSTEDIFSFLFKK